MAVGMAITHGCIRMYPEDVAALFPLVPVGTKVWLINDPVKVAYVDGELLLEAHPPVDAEGQTTEPNLELLSQQLDKAVGNDTAAIHWDLARDTLQAANGIPAVVGLQADLDPPPAPSGTEPPASAPQGQGGSTAPPSGVAAAPGTPSTPAAGALTPPPVPTPEPPTKVLPPVSSGDGACVTPHSAASISHVAVHRRGRRLDDLTAQRSPRRLVTEVNRPQLRQHAQNRCRARGQRQQPGNQTHAT